VFDRFKVSKKDTLWYYGELAKRFKERLPEEQLAEELSEIVTAIRNDIKSHHNRSTVSRYMAVAFLTGLRLTLSAERAAG
jgi:hypothetical protein